MSMLVLMAAFSVGMWDRIARSGVLADGEFLLCMAAIMAVRFAIVAVPMRIRAFVGMGLGSRFVGMPMRFFGGISCAGSEGSKCEKEKDMRDFHDDVFFRIYN